MRAHSERPTRLARSRQLESWLSTRHTVHILSPHVDDAVYSLGGWITKSARPIVIHNIFSETLFTAAGPRLNAGAIRRREEDAAIAVLAPRVRIDRRYHGLPDLSARPSDGCLTQLQHDVAEVVSRIGNDPLDAYLVPAGVGAHPDHLLVAAAAQQPNAIRYCEIPYLVWDERGLADATCVLPVDVDLHVAAMSCFDSQVAPEVEWRRPLRAALSRLEGLPVVAECCS